MEASLSTFLSSLGDVFGAVISYLSDIFGLFISEPILIFLAGLMFTGAIISFAMRVLHRN